MLYIFYVALVLIRASQFGLLTKKGCGDTWFRRFH